MKNFCFIAISYLIGTNLFGQYDFTVYTNPINSAHQMFGPAYTGGVFDASFWKKDSLVFWLSDLEEEGSYLSNNELSVHDASFRTYLNKGQFSIDLLGFDTPNVYGYWFQLDKSMLKYRNGCYVKTITFNSTLGSIATRRYPFTYCIAPEVGNNGVIIESVASNPPKLVYGTWGIVAVEHPHNPNDYLAYLAAEETSSGVFQGVAVADVMNFSMPHPEKPGKEIWYASIEGPEAAAYERGTAVLSNGEAFVSYSSNFQAVANPNTVTIQVNALSVESIGLAVVKKTPQGFLVKELKGGQGYFAFDWEVIGIRKGYENYQVVSNKSKE